MSEDRMKLSLLEKALAVKQENGNESTQSLERLELVLAYAHGTITSSAIASVLGTLEKSVPTLCGCTLMRGIKRGLIEVRRVG